jgi:hypothetical protein
MDTSAESRTIGELMNHSDKLTKIKDLNELLKYSARFPYLFETASPISQGAVQMLSLKSAIVILANTVAKGRTRKTYTRGNWYSGYVYIRRMIVQNRINNRLIECLELSLAGRGYHGLPLDWQDLNTYLRTHFGAQIFYDTLSANGRLPARSDFTNETATSFSLRVTGLNSIGALGKAAGIGYAILIEFKDVREDRVELLDISLEVYHKSQFMTSSRYSANAILQGKFDWDCNIAEWLRIEAELFAQVRAKLMPPEKQHEAMELWLSAYEPNYGPLIKDAGGVVVEVYRTEDAPEEAKFFCRLENSRSLPASFFLVLEAWVGAHPEQTKVQMMLTTTAGNIKQVVHKGQ